MNEETKRFINDDNNNIRIKQSRFETKMICLKCGRQAPTNFQYCPKCNKKVWPIPVMKK